MVIVNDFDYLLITSFKAFLRLGLVYNTIVSYVLIITLGSPMYRREEILNNLIKMAEINYRGQTFPGYNKPIRNDAGGTHKMKVLAKKGDKVKVVRFGHRSYGHNYSSKAKSNYLKRSAGIRNKSGELTKNDKFSANHWARKVLWPQNRKADGGTSLDRRKTASVRTKEGIKVKDKLYRPKVVNYMYDDQGRILAARSQASGSGLRDYHNYKFPGGGLDYGDTVTEGARKELLEEAGYDVGGDLFEFGEPSIEEWDENFRAQQKKKGRGQYAGAYIHNVSGPLGKRNKRLFGSEGDDLGGLDFVPLSSLQKDLRKTSIDPKNEYAFADKIKLKALKELKKELRNRNIKTAAVAVKRDPSKWEAAKREAKAKMGGKHSARAMQLATQIYKKKGGTYAGKKPSASTNKLKKWTKQKWQWSGKDKPGQGGSGVYLPKKSVSALKSTKVGRQKLVSATREKMRATRSNQQFSSHGLHQGKNRSKIG